MAFFDQGRGQKIWVVQCKTCRRDVPARITQAPTSYIPVRCPLCREVRLYLPTEVGLGFVHFEVRKLFREGF